MTTATAPSLTTFQAARAFNRIWEPIDRNLHEAATCDAGFDGGEFSGPEHGTIWEQQLDACLNRVAPQMGVEPDWLFHAWQEWCFAHNFRRFS